MSDVIIYEFVSLFTSEHVVSRIVQIPVVVHMYQNHEHRRINIPTDDRWRWYLHFNPHITNNFRPMESNINVAVPPVYQNHKRHRINITARDNRWRWYLHFKPHITNKTKPDIRAYS